jgi:hypothetical protein
MSGDHSTDSDEVLGTRLREELPRYTAPPSLRAALAQGPAPERPRVAWLPPVLAAAGTALAAALVFLLFVPRIGPADPVERLVRSVVAEHTRALMWGARRPEVVPAALPWLTQESGIGLRQVFAGDDHLQFAGAEPVYLEGYRGVALHYRDGDGHLLSYVALPIAGLPVPDRQRVSIQRGDRQWRPALMHDSGFSAWVWRQAEGQLACFLVSDMVSAADIEKFKDYFVRVRVSTDPVPAN